MKRFGYHDPCFCGSGRKFGKCCLRKLRHKQSGVRPSPPEPHLSLVSSAVGNGIRYRAVFNTIYKRPASETFHEFLIEFVKWTFGRQWWKHQLAMPSGAEHVVLRWTRAFASVTRRTPTQAISTASGTAFETVGSGPARALLSLGYDLFCLQTSDKLPTFMIERLRDRQKFQSVRYEIAVAGIMLRAGFEIKLLDEQVWNSKHCEFVATHRTTGLRVSVEAKSRVRSGALHEPGEFSYTEDVRGLLKLARKASKQGAQDMALAIFLDVNLPPTPSVPPVEKQWVRDANEVADQLDRRALQSGDGTAAHSLLMMTNFGFQFGAENEVEAPLEIGAILPACPRIQLPTDLVTAIIQNTQRYGRIPVEV